MALALSCIAPIALSCIAPMRRWCCRGHPTRPRQRCSRPRSSTRPSWAASRSTPSGAGLLIAVLAFVPHVASGHPEPRLTSKQVLLTAKRTLLVSQTMLPLLGSVIALLPGNLRMHSACLQMQAWCRAGRVHAKLITHSGRPLLASDCMATEAARAGSLSKS